MKKTIAVLAVLLVALLTVSAAQKGDIVAGGKLGFYSSNLAVEGEKVKISNFQIAANGQYFFTDEIAAYVDLGLGLGGKLAVHGEPTMPDGVPGVSSKATLEFSAGASYEYEIQKGLNAIGSVGLGRKAIKFAAADDEYEAFWFLTLDVTAAASYQLDKKNGIELNAGARFSIPVGDIHVEMKSGSIDAKMTEDVSGFGFTPFIGATIAL